VVPSGTISDDIATKGWRLEAGGWRLEAGGWRLEAGGWRLEAGGHVALERARDLIPTQRRFGGGDTSLQRA
jgi:hypothetical protein